MGTGLLKADRDRFPGDLSSGRLAAFLSLLMIPAAPVTYLPAFLLGTAFQSALGLSEGENLREAGAWGVAAGIVLIVLMLIPPGVGIVLGARARRLGEPRLGTIGLVANALIAAWVLLANMVGLVA